MGRYDKSIKSFEEARQTIAGGVNSNVRLAGQPVPLFFERGAGAHLYDVDGNRYIDYVLGMGPAIMGHAPPAVIQAVAETLSQGQVFGGQNPHEVTLAQTMTRLIPCAELVRFASSGSEASHGALRLARAYTGRGKVIKFQGHYHGWLDSIYAGYREIPADAMAPTPESPGQSAHSLADLIVLPWNDLAAVENTIAAHGDDIAAIIMEPIMCNTGVILPRAGYLEGVRELCSTRGIVLIFDEVITGFRVGLKGAQGLLGITPDMAIYAKAVAAGFPLSAIVGKRAIMETVETQGVLHGGTYNANVVAMSAANAAMAELAQDNGAAFSTMIARGNRLMEGITQAAGSTGLRVQGLGSVFNTAFSAKDATDYSTATQADGTLLAEFLDGLQERGVRVTSRGTWFLSTAHGEEDVDKSLEAVQATLRAMNS